MPLLWGPIRWRSRRRHWYDIYNLPIAPNGFKKDEAYMTVARFYGSCAPFSVRVASVLTVFCPQIRAAEDILSLTRILKEAWLFGKLQTVGSSEAETRAEAAAVKVAAGLSRLRGGNGAEATGSNREPTGSDGDGRGVGKEGEERTG